MTTTISELERDVTAAHGDATKSEAIATLRGVTKKYGQTTALNGISLDIRKGEIVSLLGPNGAGKTTSVRLLLGLSRPTSGQVKLFGANPYDRKARMRVGAMLQVGSGGVPSELKVSEHIDLFRSYYPRPLPAADVLAIAGLEDIAGRKFGKLSGGQRQRVLLGLALCGDPELLFLDEPTVGMDVEARRALWAQVRQWSALGKTVLLTTHYLEEADALADRIVVIQRGAVVAEGTPREIKATQGVRKIRCETSLDAALLLAIPSVTDVAHIGSTTVVTARDPEAVIRKMMERDRTLSGLEITGAGLEEAFLAITNSESTTLEARKD